MTSKERESIISLWLQSDILKGIVKSEAEVREKVLEYNMCFESLLPIKWLQHKEYKQ